MKITDNNNKTISEASAIMAYFGRHAGQTLQGFMEEIRALKPEDKTELAKGAAIALGHTVED